MNKDMITGVLFLGLKKAFDVVDHSTLIKNLSMYGVSDKSLGWFKDYLSNRQQCTKANSVISTYGPSACGVPQWSMVSGTSGHFAFSLFHSCSNMQQSKNADTFLPFCSKIILAEWQVNTCSQLQNYKL